MQGHGSLALVPIQPCGDEPGMWTSLTADQRAPHSHASESARSPWVIAAQIAVTTSITTNS